MFYHLKKANVVADALRHKTRVTITMMNVWALTEQFVDWHPWLVAHWLNYDATVGTKLIELIWEIQKKDEGMNMWRKLSMGIALSQ